MNWDEIVRTLGTVLIGSGAIVWLVKSLWSQFLARDIETFRANLENRNSVEIERLKGELKRISFEHETRYARIYDKRADALEELFKRMVKANRAFANKFYAIRFAGDPSPEEQTKRAGEAANEFIDWFTENRLFIDNDLADKILLVNHKFQGAWMSDSLMSGEERKRLVSEFFKVTPVMIDEIRARILEILSPKILRR